MNDLRGTELAERQIAKILADLERETGETVESVYLHEMDITSIGSEGRECQVNVHIQMYRVPGHRWSA